MKNLQTFNEFLNESLLNESGQDVYKDSLKTIRLKLPSIAKINDMWDNGKRSVVNNLKQKVHDAKSKLEANYNKEQSTHDRPGVISDINGDLITLRAYIKDINQEMSIKNLEF